MTATLAQLAAGAVRGEAVGAVVRLLGISYAAAPIGERRFASPAPLAPWAGERDATAPGPIAPHSVRDLPGLDVGRRSGAVGSPATTI